MIDGGPALPDHADVVVVGAGHNSLVAAAYLARAGLEVLVLEAAPTVGGNTRTEPLTLPGFAHDSCSSAHVLIQNNPLVRDDELGLVADHGLRYLTTNPAVVMPQPDGDVLVMRPDLEATATELARWSDRDARAFEDMVGAWRGGLAAAHGRWSSQLPQPEDDDTTRAYLALRRRTAWDVVHETFEHPVVRSFVLWLAMATVQDPRRPGTGFLPSSLTVGRLDHGWTTPVGGSQALPDALVRALTAHGGQVVCDAAVTGLVTDGDRVVAVQVGEHSVAVGRAVVDGGHLVRIADTVQGREPTPDLLTARDAWRPGLSVLAVHAALSSDLTFGDSAVASAAAGLGTTEGMARHLDRCAAGEADTEDPWLLVVNQTVVDRTRVEGTGATFKILTMAPWERSDGRSWADAKDEHGAALVDLVRRRCSGLDAADVLAIRTESPVDVAAHNHQNVGGSCHGGEFLLDGEVVAGWQRYDTDIPGLYLTGSTTHPGGSVSGRPGRNAARTVLTSLGLDPLAVMGAS